MPCTLLPSPRFVLVTLTALCLFPFPCKPFKLHCHPRNTLSFSYPALAALSPPQSLTLWGQKRGWSMVV